MAYTTIDDPSAYFQTALYTGGNGSNNTPIDVTNSGNSDLQPDWVWIKRRDAAASHGLFDSSRGVNKILNSDSTDAEVTGETDLVDEFKTDGFGLGANTGSENVNKGGTSYVAWQWAANGGTTASNSDGSITSTVQANTTAGFSIVTYTGTQSNATVGHGLGAVPSWIITKCRSSSNGWPIFHHKNTSAPETELIRLNEVSATADNAVPWNDTAPTSTVFTVGANDENNKSSATQLAYCFAEKQGYSKFGSYTGNGSENGPFVYLGFKPQWIMFKNTGAAEEWVLYDTTRDSTNPNTKTIRVDSNIAEAEATTLDIDFLSNGFKNRSNQAQLNSDGVLYIYMAFAESPFVSSEGVPTTAR